VFPEGENTKVVEAARQLVEEGLARPILLGNPEVIEAKAKHFGLDLKLVTVIDPTRSEHLPEFTKELYALQCRKGYSPKKVEHYVRRPIHQSMMMLRLGMADGMVAGIERSYVDTIGFVLPLLELKPGVTRAVGVHVLLVEGKVFLFADTTLNIEPDPQQLADIALSASDVAKHFGIDPRIAMLSFSNFGDNNHPKAKKVRQAVEILHKEHPELVVDGEMHGDVALLPDYAKQNFPTSRVQGDANVLIFPDLQSGNIAYKLVTHLSKGEVIGPLLIGLKHPVNIVSFHSDVRDIVNMAAISASQAE